MYTNSEVDLSYVTALLWFMHCGWWLLGYLFRVVACTSKDAWMKFLINTLNAASYAVVLVLALPNVAIFCSQWFHFVGLLTQSWILGKQDSLHQQTSNHNPLLEKTEKKKKKISNLHLPLSTFLASLTWCLVNHFSCQFCLQVVWIKWLYETMFWVEQESNKAPSNWYSSLWSDQLHFGLYAMTITNKIKWPSACCWLVDVINWTLQVFSL